MDRLIEKVMEEDESVIETFRPNRKKMILSEFVLPSIVVLICLLGGIIAMIADADVSNWYVLVYTCVIAVLEIIMLSFVLLSSKKTCYVVTNKRVIMHLGGFGDEIKSLNLDMIVAVDVSEGVIDKMLKTNTGAVSFVSLNLEKKNSSVLGYVFKHVENPYEISKIMKKVLEENVSTKTEILKK